MATASKKNFKISKGSTFLEILRWETDTKVFKNITGVSRRAPLTMTVVGHGAPNGWRVQLSNVGGMKELNTSEYLIITEVPSVDSITFGSINAAGYSPYTSGGVLEYNAPKDMANMTAKMYIKYKISLDTFILELSTTNGMILIDNILKTITLNIPASVTETLDIGTYVYSLEMYQSTQVFSLLTGSIVVENKVTR